MDVLVLLAMLALIPGAFVIADVVSGAVTGVLAFALIVAVLAAPVVWLCTRD